MKSGIGFSQQLCIGTFRNVNEACLLVATRCHADVVRWHLGYDPLYLSHLCGNGKSGGNESCSQPNYNL